MECTVCCEKYNSKDKCKTSCSYCNYECCQKCVETYLLSITENANCMNCHRAWDVDVLEKMVHKTFRIQKYKMHRENVLFDREKSLLPATQPEVQRVMQERNHNEQIRVYQAQLKKLREEMNHAQTMVYEHRRAIHRLNRRYIMEERFPVKRTFTIPCPRNECKGFITEGEWNCGICSHYTCSKCHDYIGESKEIPHECKPENIETAKLIKKDSRSCPGCSTLIFRISGCNQMWCTQCYTAFDWVTGLVEKGVVHNPHYYDYQRNNPNARLRNLEDAPCGGLIDTYALRDFVNKIKNHDDFVDWLYRLHRICSHTQRVELPRYHVQYEVNNNQELRIMYLMNDITEEQFKRRLQQVEKDNHKKREIYMVLEMYIHTMIDLFRNLISERKLYEDSLNHWRKEVENLQKYANRYFEKISQRYNCVVPVIRSSDFTTYRY